MKYPLILVTRTNVETTVCIVDDLDHLRRIAEQAEELWDWSPDSTEDDFMEAIAADVQSARYLETREDVEEFLDSDASFDCWENVRMCARIIHLLEN